MSEIKIKRKYYSTGQLHYESPYQNGQRHGIERHWYKNGQINWEISYRNGKLHGVEKSWHRNGQLNYKVFLRTDKGMAQGSGGMKMENWNLTTIIYTVKEYPQKNTLNTN